MDETESTLDETETRFDGTESYFGEESDVEDTQEDFSKVSKRSTSKPITNKKRKLEPTKKEKADQLLDKAMQILDNRKPRAVEDEDETYCKHLAFQLKGLPVMERKFVKFKIQELIFNTQFNGINFGQAHQNNNFSTLLGNNISQSAHMQATNGFGSPISTPLQSPTSGIMSPPSISSPTYPSSSLY